MSEQFDFIAIGDVVTDAFVNLDSVQILEQERGPDLMAVRYGDKIPFNWHKIIPGVGNSANAAVSATRLGLKTAYVVNVGSDAYGKEQIEALLHQTNLYAVRQKAVSTFSGGMRQRFGIAQALLGNPKLIIVDEPTAGLDPEERNRFHNLLSDIGEQVIVILSTHIVEDVKNLCNKMAILGKGELLAQGEPSELISNLDGKVWSKTILKEKYLFLLGHLGIYS